MKISEQKKTAASRRTATVADSSVPPQDFHRVVISASYIIHGSSTCLCMHLLHSSEYNHAVGIIYEFVEYNFIRQKTAFINLSVHLECIKISKSLRYFD